MRQPDPRGRSHKYGVLDLIGTCCRCCLLNCAATGAGSYLQRIMRTVETSEGRASSAESAIDRKHVASIKVAQTFSSSTACAGASLCLNIILLIILVRSKYTIVCDSGCHATRARYIILAGRYIVTSGRSRVIVTFHIRACLNGEMQIRRLSTDPRYTTEVASC